MSPFSVKTGRSTSILDAFCPDLGSAVSPRGSGVTLEFFRRGGSVGEARPGAGSVSTDVSDVV